ncbi:uncharacterized protein [Petaurus breviceps papuanus]|uniref:uncharacterized protein n=1 Tax=Petaurus breviceps papuanus TaxID=3040969 RepID=UPI0036DACB89
MEKSKGRARAGAGSVAGQGPGCWAREGTRRGRGGDGGGGGSGGGGGGGGGEEEGEEEEEESENGGWLLPAPARGFSSRGSDAAATGTMGDRGTRISELEGTSVTIPSKPYLTKDPPRCPRQVTQALLEDL